MQIEPLFGLWLCNQHERTDNVGMLARELLRQMKYEGQNPNDFKSATQFRKNLTAKNASMKYMHAFDYAAEEWLDTKSSPLCMVSKV